ncbi:hypothetical protein R3P38DRAFT_1946819 [Favolaschia claudopus]|uniref:DUF6534 domain-containing protein n=1 Tax=Favolaschia claudopus TaxID=2862362 RepID=A0AAW0A067_9AGAR
MTTLGSGPFSSFLLPSLAGVFSPLVGFLFIPSLCPSNSIMAGVDLLFGPMLIGVALNLMLFGAVVTQMYQYYQRFANNDFVWIRYLMLYLFLVEIANVVVELGIIYEPLIVRNGEQAALLHIPKLLPGDSIIISLVSAPIQLFTAWRISVITRSYILPSIISILAIGAFASGINMSVSVYSNPTFREFSNFTSSAIVWLVLAATCDVVIAIGMSHALYTRKTGFTAVDGQINRIIRLTLETGALTAFTALIDVGLFIAFPKKAFNFIVDFPLSALYTLSILAMLNSRDERKASSDAEHGTSRTAVQMLSTTDQSTVKPLSLAPVAQCSFHGAANSPQSRTQSGMFASRSTLTFDTASEKTFVMKTHQEHPDAISPSSKLGPQRF